MLRSFTLISGKYFIQNVIRLIVEVIEEDNGHVSQTHISVVVLFL